MDEQMVYNEGDQKALVVGNRDVVGKQQPGYDIRVNPMLGDTDVVGKQNEVLTVFDWMLPYHPDDGSKGSFLLMVLAGLDKSTAAKAIRRKPCTHLSWRRDDAQFRMLDDKVFEMRGELAGQARVIRASLLDASIVEAGIMLLGRIFEGEVMSDGAWSYITKLAAMRVPLMMTGTGGESGISSWQKLARQLAQVTPIITKRKLTVQETQMTPEEVVDMERMSGIAGDGKVRLVGSNQNRDKLSDGREMPAMRQSAADTIRMVSMEETRITGKSAEELVREALAGMDGIDS